MKDIAIQLRLLNLAAHGGHLLVTGATSYSDHKLLGKFYEELFTQYDGAVEKIIQGEGWVSPMAINEAAIEEQGKLNEPTKGDAIFDQLLQLEEKLQGMITSYLKDDLCNDGIQNFLQGLHESSLDRCYLIQQRLG